MEKEVTIGKVRGKESIVRHTESKPMAKCNTTVKGRVAEWIKQSMSSMTQLFTAYRRHLRFKNKYIDSERFGMGGNL